MHRTASFFFFNYKAKRKTKQTLILIYTVPGPANNFAHVKNDEKIAISDNISGDGIPLV